MFFANTKPVTNPLLESPSRRAISVSEAKSHLRVSSSDEDALIESYVDAALAAIEGPGGLGIGVLERQWRITLDGFPPTIWLEITPVLSLDEISYLDGAGASQILTVDTDYRVDLDHEPARVVPAYGKSWPATLATIGAVTVLYTAGYRQGEGIPADLRVAMLQTIASNYENRESIVVGTSAMRIPDSAMETFERYRVGRFA